MSPADYQRAAALFERLRDLPVGEHAAALDASCAGNGALRAQVWQLLEADREAAAGSFLERHAIEDAARLLAQEPAKVRLFAAGARFGPYEIVALLGAGGMGEVYRARDSQLDRDVAIKLLPPELAGDPQYMARFEREAKVLASLNHPNIATVYGIEQGALVMELVEGDNLRGPLPLEEALPIARQIAVGLEAAHERGIVHRDLKPANIKITPAGVVKLLDFGLAKSATDLPRSGPASPALSPSPSPAMTQAGTILGTAAYMSPEQARGKAVDKRADIFAFGVVFYEILTGRQLFGGETTTDTLAAVVKDTPDLDRLPAETPRHVRRLLARCLRKDVNRRLRDIGEARLLLDEPAEVLGQEPPASARRTWRPWAAAVAAALAAVALGALWLRRPAEGAHMLRVSVLPPVKSSFAATSLPAVSPDGRHLAFAAGDDGKSQLWIRDLDSLNARPLSDTEGAFDPFWSPDNRMVAFFVPGKLKKVDIAGSVPVTVCDAPDGRGGSWNRSDVIVFAPSFGAPLFRVSAVGGTATPLTTLDESAAETSHRFPWFLADGRHFLFTARGGSQERTAIYAGDLDSKERRLVVAAASNAVYSPPGFLLYMRERTLMAQAFDAAGLRTKGEPVPVADPVDYVQGVVQGQFAVSQTGVLVYYSGGGALSSRLTWLDRDGRPAGTVGPPGIMQAPAISPDGGRVVVDRLDTRLGTYDLWLHDLVQGTGSRFTLDPANDMFPVWSPDGSRILFASNRTGNYGLYQKSAAGGGKEELLYQTAGVTLATDWSRDGRFAIFFNTAQRTADDLWVLPLAGDRKAFPFLQTRFSESEGRLSPDGRWLAYQSNESGVNKVYVETFPVGEGKWQVSAAGGTRPVWSRDGKELFYIGDNKMMAVDVKSGVEFEHGTPKALFEVRTAPTARYDVARDGKRFLMLYPGEPDGNATMTVVVNWQAGVKK